MKRLKTNINIQLFTLKKQVADKIIFLKQTAKISCPTSSALLKVVLHQGTSFNHNFTSIKFPLIFVPFKEYNILRNTLKACFNEIIFLKTANIFIKDTNIFDKIMHTFIFVAFQSYIKLNFFFLKKLINLSFQN